MKEKTKTKIDFDFDYRKATQALNWFAIKGGGKINKMKALKLIYLADRYHLRKYGRLVTNDSYVAMEHGPVASSTRDIVEKSDFIDSHQRQYADNYIAGKGKYDIQSAVSPDNDVFSDSDIEALKFAWKKFGHLDQFELADLTHKYPEWISCEEELKHKESTPIDLMDFFNDPNTNVDKCFDLSDKDKDLRREHVKETVYIESLWR